MSSSAVFKVPSSVNPTNMKSVASAARLVSKRPYRVSIEGNIGSGKSTCIKHFEKYNNVETHAVSKKTCCFLVIYGAFCNKSSPTRL